MGRSDPLKGCRYIGEILEKEALPFGEGLGPVAREPSLSSASLCLCTSHSASSTTWSRGNVWLPRGSHTSDLRSGRFQTPLCCLFILNS